MRLTFLGILSAGTLLAGSYAAQAASLQVSPISVDIQAPAATSTITLTNAGAEEINAQVRVFKWSQVNGVEQLVPTTDVVASPPAVKIAGNKDSVVRLVRLSKTPITGEETYRLKVDEVPKAAHGGAAVSFAISYSVPVFFTAPDQKANLGWTAAIVKGQLKLEATNSGGKHSRLADLKIIDGAKTLVVGPGLAGYVLTQSKRDWIAKSAAKTVKVGDSVEIIATTDAGPLEATANVVGGN